jgi:hypothetical protein
MMGSKMTFAASFIASTAALAVGTSVSAAVLYSETFESDVSASWTTNQGPAASTNVATFGYDYSALGIPAAPGVSTTRGLRLQANIGTTGTLGGISTSPNGQSFTGDYVVRFNAWQNYGGTGGTTTLNTYTIGATGNTAQRPGGTIEGILFASSTDGGTASDYRAYDPGSDGVQITAPGTYAAGSQNNTAAYYETAVFPGSASAPAIQGTGLTAPDGTPAFSWQRVEIYKIGSTVNWLINGKIVATVNLATVDPLVGSNIALGQSDINNGVNNANLVFGLIDNLVVDSTVPEPTSLTALAGAALVLRRRRK